MKTIIYYSVAFFILTHTNDASDIKVLPSSHEQNQTIIQNNPTSRQWEYKEIPSNKISRKLPNIKVDAEYVQSEKRYLRKKSNNSYIFTKKFDDNFKKY